VSNVPMIQFNNGVEIPQLGFGVFQVPPAETRRAVLAAFEAGYRHIDTAEMYRNEEGVGAALAESGLARDDVFITSKLNNGHHRRDDALRAFDGTLKALGIDKIDLFVIHWPLPAQDLYVEAWRALEEIYRDGRARAIGLSNFTARHIGRLLAETEVVPALNQIELHPYLSQAEMRAFDTEHQIITEAWSPIGGQRGAVLSDRSLAALGEKYGKSPAQVVLRWHIELGNVVIPKSTHAERMAENFDIFDFELAPDDVAMISGLDRSGRVGPNPETFNPH
jgi:diketogulonate reductase-like aldo/keto reductase